MTVPRVESEEEKLWPVLLDNRIFSRFSSIVLIMIRSMRRMRIKTGKNDKQKLIPDEEAELPVIIECSENEGQLSVERSEQRNRRSDGKKSISWQLDDAENDIDGGYAWIILPVVFVINVSTFGSARAYGLIYQYSARHDHLSCSEAALPFTIQGAVDNMAGPLTGFLLVSTGSWRMVVFAGSCLVTLSHLLVAYFSSKPGQILTMGLMCGVGQSFIAISFFQINNAYFRRFRSGAFGVALSGAAVGALYISPLCTYLLENQGKSLCYLMLGLMMFPNVALSLLLKVKESTPIHSSDASNSDEVPLSKRKFSIPEAALAAVAAQRFPLTAQIPSAAIRRRHSEHPRRSHSRSSQMMARNMGQVKANESNSVSVSDDTFMGKVKQVLTTPLFHLIWPTQLIFCWLNFVFGIILTDFGEDRGLDAAQNSRLIDVWALGQLFGRLCLGSLIDLQIISYKSFTTVCFATISLTTFGLNTFGQVKVVAGDGAGTSGSNQFYLLVFILSAFISTLYILFNGLVFEYMDDSVAALSIGISSFTGSFFLLPRATVIGLYKAKSGGNCGRSCGNYDGLLTMFTCVTIITALVWQLVPALLAHMRGRNRRLLVSAPQVDDFVRRCNSVPINRLNSLQAYELLTGFSTSNRRISPGKKMQIPTIAEDVSVKSATNE